jgi:hypothetical protein
MFNKVYSKVLQSQKWKIMILVKTFTKSFWFNDIIQNVNKNKVKAKPSTCDSFFEVHLMFSLVCFTNLLLVGALCFQLFCSICSF